MRSQFEELPRLSNSSCLPVSSVIGPIRFERGFIAAQPMLQIRRGPDLATPAQGALPDNRDPPARIQQVVSIAPVPIHVVTKLLLPELRPAYGRGCIPARCMAVPEAAVNETDGAKPSKHQIRGSGQASVVKAIPDTTRMQGTAKKQFR